MDGHKTVMITGGCGAIGSVVVNRLKKEYRDTLFVNIDALTYCANESFIEQPHDNYHFYYGSINDASFVSYVLRTEKPTLIIHLAAETHVDTSFGNSLKFTDTNVMGTHTLLECVKNYGGVKHFLHMSTDEVYGSVCDNEACEEGSLFAPSNPYSASKAAAEMICHAYMKSFGVPITIMRCNNAISPYQHEEKLVPRCVQTLLEIKEGSTARIPIHGRGESKRTFIHAADIARAIDVIAAKGAIGSVYNIGTFDNMEYSVVDVVRIIIKKMMGDDANIEDFVKYVDDRAFQDYRYCIDSTALRSLGWCEETSFEDAIDDVIKYKTSVWKNNKK
jgi:dTDP-glucose 4,6-dehydratase